MPIKGCSRRVILVKDPDSRYFDQICFYLRAELPKSVSEGDMLRAAAALAERELGENERTSQASSEARGGSVHSGERIRIARDITSPTKKRTPVKGLLAYFSGAATVGLLGGAAALVSRLF